MKKVKKKYIKKFTRWLALLTAAVLAVTLSACGKNSEIKLGTGNEGGVYFKFGNLIQQLDSRVTVKKTAGSQANLRLLDDGFVDMAIVQSDVLSEAVNGTGDFKNQKIESLRAVAGLYMENFQIIVSADSDIQTVADLDGKRVSVGEDGSGVAKNAEYILNSVGLDISMLNVCNLTYAQSAEALKDKSIDAFFVVLGAPSTVITELAESTDIRVLSLDDRTVSYMTNLYSGYYPSTIKAGTYKGQTEDIKTIGVKAVLVADSSVHNEAVKEILTAIFDNGGKIKEDIPFAEPDKTFASSDIPCSFHQGAAVYYNDNDITVNTDPSKKTAKLVIADDN